MAIVLKIVHQDEDYEIKITGSLTIGRGSKVDIRIKDEALSSLHGKFKLEPNGKLLYEDLNSKNGSYLNGLGIYASQIMLEDVLRLGSAEIYIDTPSLTTSERYDIGRRVQKGKRQKDITFVKDKS